VIARTPLGRTLAVVLSAVLSQIYAPAARAAEGHLVPPAQVASRLADREAERLQQIQTVQSVLDGDLARSQAAAMGLSIGKLRSAVPHLSDAELADIYARAAHVKDIAAGHHHHHDDSLLIVGIILLILGIALIVAFADHHGYYDCGGGCY
jgi:hypothetical protein